MSELLAAHRRSLSQLRASVEDHPHFKPALHDSIFLLRFLLSHPPARGSVAAATRALRRALTIRAENDLDRIGAYVLANPSRNWDGGRWRWWSHMLPVLMCQPEADGPAFMMGRVKDFDMHGVVRDLPRADFSRATMFLMEWIFQVMDRATRRTGVIVKYHRLLDVSGVSLSQVSLRFVRRDADDNKELQCLYPQLLGSVCFLNPPPAIRWLWGSVLAPLMPKKVTEKTLVRVGGCDLPCAGLPCAGLPSPPL